MATASMMVGGGAATETIAGEPTLHMKLQMPHPPNSKYPGGPTKMRQKLRLDPSRALEPARKKIATIEAQRVMSVFEDTINKTEIVTLLPYILENKERFRVSLGAELSLLLDIHKNTVESYEEIKQQLDIQLRRNRIRTATPQSPARSDNGDLPAAEATDDTMRDSTEPAQEEVPEETDGDEVRSPSLAVGKAALSTSRRSSIASQKSYQSVMSYDSQTERTMRNLSLVAQQLSSSCKNILRAFTLNPNVLSSIKGQAKRDDVCSDVVGKLNELKEILMNKLLTTPEEEKERMQYIQEISKRERHNASIIDDLETKLKAAMDEKDEEVRVVFKKSH